MKIRKYSKEMLLKWINEDPYKEALLVDKVPVSSTTLNRIKSGNYIPSKLLQNSIMNVIEKN